MVVRIRFRHGPRVERRKGKNSRIAWLAASLLALVSVSCLILGLWRLGVDFGWAGAFVFPDESLYGHWQIWIAAAVVVQTLAWKLNRYGKPKPGEEPESQPGATANQPLSETRAAAASK